ncbi:9366_t:CDS:1, partial [Scutellospora calospora]
KIQKSQQNNIENSLIIELAEQICTQQDYLLEITEENKKLKKHIKKIEHSENEKEKEMSNKESTSSSSDSQE